MSNDPREHKKVIVDDQTKLESILNQMSREGWRRDDTFQPDSQGRIMIIFSRPAPRHEKPLHG